MKWNFLLWGNWIPFQTECKFRFYRHFTGENGKSLALSLESQTTYIKSRRIFFFNFFSFWAPNLPWKNHRNFTKSLSAHCPLQMYKTAKFKKNPLGGSLASAVLVKSTAMAEPKASQNAPKSSQLPTYIHVGANY